MKNVKIIMWCFLNKEDIEKIFDNFSDSYPEVEMEESYYDQSLEDGTLEFTWEGIIGEKSVDDIIRLTHHAEGIYEDTSAEYVHVEVCIDGKWYGRM